MHFAFVTPGTTRKFVFGTESECFWNLKRTSTFEGTRIWSRFPTFEHGFCNKCFVVMFAKSLVETCFHWDYVKARVFESCFAVMFWIEVFGICIPEGCIEYNHLSCKLWCVHSMKIVFHAWTKQSCLKARWNVFSFAQSWIFAWPDCFGNTSTVFHVCSTSCFWVFVTTCF